MTWKCVRLGDGVPPKRTKVHRREGAKVAED